jgi:hypothetical protein
MMVNHGGPLGVGDDIIELNPDYPGRKKKKYNIYSTSVVNMQPVGLGNKVFSSNSTKDIARCVKNSHHERLCA